VWLLVQVRTSGDFLAANTHISTGPAHAVYFATYEAVKHVMGGNQAGVHHPLAAGMFCRIFRLSWVLLTLGQPPAGLAQQLQVMPS